jgi:hypothetical protein
MGVKGTQHDVPRSVTGGNVSHIDFSGERPSRPIARTLSALTQMHAHIERRGVHGPMGGTGSKVRAFDNAAH